MILISNKSRDCQFAIAMLGIESLAIVSSDFNLIALLHPLDSTYSDFLRGNADSWVGFQCCAHDTCI